MYLYRISFPHFQGVELWASGNKSIDWSHSWTLNLELLDISNCNLDAIPLVVKESSNLLVLNMENNRLSSVIGLDLLKKLQTLNISSNQLTDVSETTKTLGRLAHLSILNVCNNSFTSSEPESKSQAEVADILIETCFVYSCKSLKMFNLEKISSGARKRADRRMNALRLKAASQRRKSNVFSGWVPGIQPLVDMTIDEDLVLEVL